MKTGAAVRMLAVLATLANVASGQDSLGVLTPPPPQTSNEPPGTLTGHVLNSITAEPVKGATVILQNFSRGGNVQSVTTDGAGAFSATNLVPGNYTLQVSHPAYQGILGMPPPSRTAIVASGEETSGVSLGLVPGGRISGRVLDDGGEPLAGCPVWVLGPRQGGGTGTYAQKGGTSTNDKGEYRFDELAADRYLAYVRCQESLPVERTLAVWVPEQIQPGESWQPAFYPDNPSPEGAQWLTVLPGSELTNIDFRLKTTPVTTVSGTISGIPAGEPGSQPNIQLVPADSGLDSSLGFGAAFNPTNSTFQVQMVPPGSYKLEVISTPAQAESLAYASVPVRVGRTRPAPLYVQMHAGITLGGVVEQPPTVNSGAGPSPIMMNSLQNPGRQAPTASPMGYVNLVPLNQSMFSSMRQVEVGHDGTFTARGLTPGRYRVVAQVFGGSQLTMESVQLGSVPAEHGVIDVTEGATGSLRVRMAANPPQVSANLADAPSRGDWAVFALGVDELYGMFNQPTMSTGKSGDTVRMQNLGAGKFVFVAMETSMFGGMQNDRINQILREQLEPVEIGPGQEVTISPRFFTSVEIGNLALAYLRGETH